MSNIELAIYRHQINHERSRRKQELINRHTDEFKSLKAEKGKIDLMRSRCTAYSVINKALNELKEKVRQSHFAEWMIL